MTTQGIKITDLRPEIQTLVNSNPMRYDPNNNGAIDDGEELSQLLSEYGCRTKDLTSERHPKRMMLTSAEKVELKEAYLENHRFSIDYNPSFHNIGAILGGTAVGFLTGAATDYFMGLKKCGEGIRTVGSIAVGVVTLIGVKKLISNIYKKRDRDVLKANEAEQGARIKNARTQQREQQRLNAIKNKEAELNQRETTLDAREAELNQREADFNSNVTKTSKQVEQNVNKANQKAVNLNKELDKMQEKVQQEE